MSALTLFTDLSNAVADLQKAKPQYLANMEDLAGYADAINNDIASGTTFPVLSIKGKVFTLKKDGENKPLMKNEDEALQFINVAVVRANPNARHYYANDYVEGEEGSGAAPDCYSNDGIRPAPDAKAPQSDTCATCPHAVWGTGKNGVGTACTVNTRLAIVAPELLASGEADPTLLRVPAGSRKNFADVVSQAKRHRVPYTAMVIKVGFDFQSPGVKLTFKPVGFLNDASFQAIRDLAEDETVKAIVGVVEESGAAPVVKPAPAAKPAPAPKAKPAAKPAPEPKVDSVDDLLGDMAEAPAPKSKPAAKAAPAPKPVAKAEPESEPVAAAAEAAVAGGDMADTLSDIDALLGSFDD